MNATAHVLDNFAGNGQAEAGALADGFCSKKRVENSWQYFLGDTSGIVLNPDMQFSKVAVMCKRLRTAFGQ